MHRRVLLGSFAAAILPFAVRGAAPTASAAARDVLDTPAGKSVLAQRGLLTGLARAGKRVVAVGQRGHVLYSDDAGQRWQQADVPVSSDLVAVHFPDAENGWAVGHDGVILGSTDGGRTWARRLDGRGLGEVLVAHYTKLADAKWLDEAKKFAQQGAENPFLDVWFQDARTGYVVGAFGLVLHTADGGKTWEPMLHATDNPKGLHIYSVRGIGGDIYLAGEQGLLLKLGRDTGRFVAQSTPYQGTLFGLVGNDQAVLAHGLRGNIVRTTDGGRNWHSVPTGLTVGLTASTVDERGRIVIVSQAGHVLASADAGATFKPVKIERPVPAAAVVTTGSGSLVIAGPRGVQSLPLA